MMAARGAPIIPCPLPAAQGLTLTLPCVTSGDEKGEKNLHAGGGGSAPLKTTNVSTTPADGSPPSKTSAPTSSPTRTPKAFRSRLTLLTTPGKIGPCPPTLPP